MFLSCASVPFSRRALAVIGRGQGQTLSTPAHRLSSWRLPTRQGQTLPTSASPRALSAFHRSGLNPCAVVSVRAKSRVIRNVGLIDSVIPLALAAIAIHIHRTSCGDYGIYLPTSRLARFQMGRIQPLFSSSRCPKLSGAIIGTYGWAWPSAQSSGYTDDPHR